MDRIPPHSMDAEQAVLGSMLIERAAVERAAETLKAEDFYRDAHRTIFEAMLALAERDEPVDAITLSDELKSRDQFERVGGQLYLLNLMEAPATAANIEYYAHMVEEKAILRRLMDAGTRIQGLAHSEFDVVDDVVDQAERIVFEVGQRRMGQYFHHLRPLLNEELDRIEKRYENKGAPTGRLTPFDDLNYKTAGLQPSDLIIVAARPGMGKCLRYDTLVDDPLTGERMTIEEAVRRKVPCVLGLDRLGNVRATSVSAWVDSGVKPCFRVRTRLGRNVEVTGHHPFLTVAGWWPLNELSVGMSIAIPRRTPIAGHNHACEPSLIRLIAYSIAAGQLERRVRIPHGLEMSKEQLVTRMICLEANVDAHRLRTGYLQNDDWQRVGEAISRLAKASVTIDDSPDVPAMGMRAKAIDDVPEEGVDPVAPCLHCQWLVSRYATVQQFPELIWTLHREGLAEFLRVLFSCLATIHNLSGYPRIEFTVASSGLASDVQHALTRFGIVSKLWRKTPKSWRVEITDPTSVDLYQQEINWLGEKAGRFKCIDAVARRSIRGHAPREVWAQVLEAARRKGLSLCELARRSGEHAPKDGYNPHTNRSLPLARLRAYAEVLDDDHLRMISNDDLYWDEIVEVTPTGEHQVYDLTVPDGANFIAQDMCVHNTTLAVQVSQFIALEEKIPVAIFSLEMSKEQLVTRMICSEAKVDAHRLRTGYLQNDDWQRVGEAISRLAEAPIYIDDSPDVSAMEMRAKCRRLKAEQGLGLVMIDYLQLMRSHKKTENRNQEISEIARACKGLARELRVPVIALSQLSRAVESRPDKRPLLSDLRESGSIEAEADIVMFIYREAYYKMKEAGEAAHETEMRERGEEKLEETELIIAKHRSGPTGKVYVGFLPHYTRFENLDRTHGGEEE